MASNRYTVLRKIADGGMAEIFLAKLEGSQGFQKLVVLKRIRAAILADPQFRDMLVHEAHVAMTLNHGNIVQVLDLGEAQGRYFLALELVDGWSVAQLIKRAQAAAFPLPPQLSLYIVAQVCRALSFAHARTREGEAQGIIHRDVSPQNILVSEHGEVKLTDFGIAKVQNRTDITQAGVVKGKIAFMSPEQAQGAPLDIRTDLFSLGTVLYNLVTDKLPFAAPTPMETMVRIQAAQFPSPAKVKPKLDKEITRVILRAMRERPADRYQTAAEMMRDIEQVMRRSFKPVGQTELAQWLADLREKDRVPPISRAPGTEKTEPDERIEAPIELGASSIIENTSPSQEKVPAVSALGIAQTVPRNQGPLLAGGGEASPPALGAKAPRPPRRLRWAMLGVGAVVVVGLLLARSRTAPLPAPEPPPGAQAGSSPDAGAAPLAVSPAPLPDASLGEAVAAGAAPDAGKADREGVADDEEEKSLLDQAVADPQSEVIGDEDGEIVPSDGGVAVAAETSAASMDSPALAAAQVPPPPKVEAPLVEEPKPAAVKPDPRPAEPAKPAVVAKASAPPLRKPEPEPAESTRRGFAPDTVSVMVSSVPAGAIVKIGPRVLGRTPIPLRFRHGILFEVRFVKSGYVSLNKRIFVLNRKNQKLTAYLKKAPPKTTTRR